jgi:DNA repair photolyase
LTDHETPAILRESASRGAVTAGYTIVRLNGSIGTIFEDWIKKAFPDRAVKVLSQIADCHQGSLNDSQWFRRQKGSGNLALAIAQLFKTNFKKHFKGRKMPVHNKTSFRRGSNYTLDLRSKS